MTIDIDRERAIRSRLRRLAQATADPPPNADTEAAILAAFDAAWTGDRAAHVTRQRSIGRVAGVIGVAAAIIIAAVVTVRLKPDTTSLRSRVATTNGDLRLGPSTLLEANPEPRRRVGKPAKAAPPTRRSGESARRAAVRQTPRTPVNTTDFVAWPGSWALPPIESGAFVRIDLPVSVLPSLGLVPPDGGPVQADVLVGQDGFARAVRIVPMDQQRH